MMIPRTRHLIICLTALCLTACAPFRPPAAPSAPLALPRHYTLYETSAPALSAPWWTTFESEELNTLMAIALKENLTLSEAWARLRQAAALHKSRGSALFPTLSGEAGADTTERGGDATTTSDTAYLGLAASYELDLWGRIRSLKEAEGERLLASRADMEAAAVTLAGEVCETWIDLIATREEIRLVTAQMNLNQTLLTALERRFENSLISVVDFLRQRKVIEQQRAEMPELAERETILENRLALLLGKPPGQAPPVTTRALPALGPLPATGLPADLLAMRPDVRAAGLRLKAEEWEIAAARADRLPALSITARARFSSDQAQTLFDNWFLNLAANLTGPIFDAGRRTAEVARARAQAEESLALYRRIVLTALAEVENSLMGEGHKKETLIALNQQLTTSRLTLTESERRYTQGVTDYVTLLGELKELQSLERKIVQERALLIKRRIALYRALGGHWPQTLSGAPPSPKE